MFLASHTGRWWRLSRTMVALVSICWPWWDFSVPMLNRRLTCFPCGHLSCAPKEKRGAASEREQFRGSVISGLSFSTETLLRMWSS